MRDSIRIGVEEAPFLPLAPGSQPRTWSNERFSIISSTTVSNGASLGFPRAFAVTPAADPRTGVLAAARPHIGSSMAVPRRQCQKITPGEV